MKVQRLRRWRLGTLVRGMFAAAGFAALTLSATAAPAVLSHITLTTNAKLVAGPNVPVDQEPRTPFGEPTLAASPTDPQLLVGASMHFGVRSWDTTVFVSRDGGYEWLPVSPPTDALGGADVQVAFDDSGATYFTVLGDSPDPKVQGKVNHGLYVFRSLDGARTWERRTFLRRSYDHEQITIDRTAGHFRGRVYMTVLYSHSLKPMVNEVGVLRSADGGKTFQGPVPIARGWYFSNPPVVFGDGTLFAPLIKAAGPGNFRTPTLIEYALSKDGGVTFSKPRLIARQYLTPDFLERKNSGETDFGAEAEVPQYSIDASSGPYRDRVYVVWGDLRYHDSRVLFSYSADHGATWSKPTVVAADVPVRGSQYQPAIAVSRNGTLGVSWFDTRDAGAQGYDEYFAASLDGGRTFLKPVRVSSTSSHPSGAGNHAFSALGSDVFAGGLWLFLGSPAGRYVAGGDYMGLAADAANNFHPFWIDARSGTNQLLTTAVSVRTAPEPMPNTAAANLTRKMALVCDRSSWDDRAGILSLPVRLKNISKEPLYPPFTVTVTAVKLPFQSNRDRAVIENAENHHSGAGAVMHYASVLRELQALPAGGLTEPVVWKIKVNRYSEEVVIGVRIDGFTPTK